MTTTKPTAGTILTAYDGQEYTKLGVQHYILTVSEQTVEIDGSNWYMVSTAAINANGKVGRRGTDFLVSEHGSIRPYNSIYSDGRYRSDFYRISKVAFDMRMAKIEASK